MSFSKKMMDRRDKFHEDYAKLVNKHLAAVAFEERDEFMMHMAEASNPYGPGVAVVDTPNSVRLATVAVD